MRPLLLAPGDHGIVGMLDMTSRQGSFIVTPTCILVPTILTYSLDPTQLTPLYYRRSP